MKFEHKIFLAGLILALTGMALNTATTWVLGWILLIIGAFLSGISLPHL